MSAFASIVVRHGLEKHLLHQSPELFQKIAECRSQLMGSSNDGNTDANEHILYTHQHMHTDLLAHIKYINETECPELHNIEVPKVYFPS